MKQRLTPGRDARSGLSLLAVIIAAMWVIEAVNSLDGGALDRDGGIYPRNLDRVWAIFTSPFLHANFYPHLFYNTIPLVFMGIFIALRGARRLAVVTLIVVVVGGIGTWLISPAGGYTIGASGLVFGYATYLFARGVFNRNLVEIVVGLVVGVIWGFALISSLVPHHGISWQAHLCGAVGGVLAAWLLAAPRTRRRDTGTKSGSGSAGSGSGGSGSGGSRSRRDTPLGGRELHSALDRALGS